MNKTLSPKEDSVSPRPKVSVVICIYNSEKYLRECIKSLMEQTLRDIEFIFIDDASTDNSASVLRRCVDKYPGRESQVRYVSHSENMGIAESRLEGVSLSRGEWVIHCDSDDIVMPDCYERLLTAANSSCADIVGCSCRVFGDDFTTFDKHEPESWISVESFYAGIGGSGKIPVLGTLWNKLIKRELWSGVKLPKGLTYCEDVIALFQILEKNPIIFYIPDVLYCYRMYPSSLIGSKDKIMVRHCEIAIPFLQDYKARLSDSRRIAVEARIIAFLYRLLKSGKMSSGDLRHIYGLYADVVNCNKSLHSTERLHLKLALQGNPLAGLIGICNNVVHGGVSTVKRLIKKVR